MLRDKYPNLRIFFSQSQSAKAKMAGNRYENVIYAALHSAKAFILVCESRQSIEWRWVRNEWQRYLILMERANEQHPRSFVLVTHNLKESDLPRELSGFQYIDYNSASAYHQLVEGFLDRAFNKNESKKLEAKTFESEVNKISLNEVGDVVATRKLKTKAEDISDDIKAVIERIERDLEYERDDAFRELEDLLVDNPNLYEAKKLLLLKETNYNHFEDYINKIGEIVAKPEIASKFFEFATEKDANETINKLTNYLSNKTFYGDTFNATKNMQLANSLSHLIMPYLDSIKKDILEKLSGQLERLTTSVFNYLTTEQQDILENFFSLRRYLDGKEAEPYLNIRKKVFHSLERLYPKPNESVIKIQKSIVNDIINVNPGDVATIWENMSLTYFGKFVTINEAVSRVEKGKNVVSVVNNADVINSFTSIFKYSDSKTRSEYMLAFLTFIIFDPRSYLKEGENVLALSKDTNGDNQLEDYELNGYDLFNKYIAYELPAIKYQSTISNDLTTDSPLFSPNEEAYLKKDKPTPIDKLICAFAVKMHKENIYAHANILYDLYLGQQDSIKKLDCLLIRYYKELSNVRVLDSNELKHIGRTLQHKSIDTDVIQLEKTLPQAGKLYSYIKKVTAFQKQYSEVYQPIKELTDQLPRESTIDKLPLIKDIESRVKKALNSIDKDVREDLQQDFASHITFFKEKLPVLEKASNEINELFKDEDTNRMISILVPSNKKGEKDLFDYYTKLVEAYDAPKDKKAHLATIERISLGLKKKAKKKIQIQRANARKEKAKEVVGTGLEYTARGIWTLIRAILLLIWPFIAMLGIYSAIDLAFVHALPQLLASIFLYSTLGVTIAQQIVVSCFKSEDAYDGWIKTLSTIARAMARIATLLFAVALFIYALPYIISIISGGNEFEISQFISLLGCIALLAILTINLYLHKDHFSTIVGGIAFILVRILLVAIPAFCLLILFGYWSNCVGEGSPWGCGCDSSGCNNNCTFAAFGVTATCTDNTASVTALSYFGGWDNLTVPQIVGLFVGLAASSVWALINGLTHAGESSKSLTKKVCIYIASGFTMAVCAGFVVLGILSVVMGLISMVMQFFSCACNGCGCAWFSCTKACAEKTLECADCSCFGCEEAIIPSTEGCGGDCNVYLNFVIGLGFWALGLLGVGASYEEIYDSF